VVLSGGTDKKRVVLKPAKNMWFRKRLPVYFTAVTEIDITVISGEQGCSKINANLAK